MRFGCLLRATATVIQLLVETGEIDKVTLKWKILVDDAHLLFSKDLALCLSVPELSGNNGPQGNVVNNYYDFS